MGDLFKALSSGLARFVYAWLLPSILVTGLFLLVIVPQLSINFDVGPLGAAATFSLAVLTLSVAFAFGSRPIYQFLEGYTMPAWLASPLRRRQQRRFAKLHALQTHGPPLEAQVAFEELKGFPETAELLMPTGLGNALKAMETYGVRRFGLDSQTFWYELQASASEQIRRATDETRSAVDFFVSSVVHLVLLTFVSLCCIPVSDNPAPLVVMGLVSAALVPFAYLQAVQNVGEWRYAVQALVNTSRSSLAKSVGLSTPDTFEAEFSMWDSLSGLVHYGRHQDYLDVLDPLRARPEGAPRTARHQRRRRTRSRGGAYLW